MAEVLRIGLLMVRRDRVMDGRVYAAVEQALLEGGAIRYTDHEEMPDMGVLAGADGREVHGRVLDLATVAGGNLAATGVVGVDVFQLHAKQRGLQFVEAVVGALDEVLIFLVRAVVAQGADHVGQLLVLAVERAGVAEGTEVLARVEAEGRGIAPGAGLDAADMSTVGLSGVFEQKEAALAAELRDRGHVGELAVEMDGEYGLHVRRERSG